MALAAILAACSANYTASPDGRDRASSDHLSPYPSTDTGSPPPLNFLEAKIVKALGTLGIDGQRAEYSFNGALVWAEFADRSALFVSAYPTATDSGDFSVLGERQIAGITVQHVEYSSGPIRDRFDCAEATYEADGAVPPGFDDFEEFLSRLIEVLDCGETAIRG